MLLLLFLPHPQRPFEVFKAKDEEKTCATPNHKGDLLTQTSLVPTKASMFALLKLKAVSNLFQKTYEDKTLKSEIHEQTGIGEIILVLCIDFRKLKILQQCLLSGRANGGFVFYKIKCQWARRMVESAHEASCEDTSPCV